MESGSERRQHFTGIFSPDKSRPPSFDVQDTVICRAVVARNNVVLELYEDIPSEPHLVAAGCS